MSDTTDNGWIGVDLDGTLAEYHGWNGGAIGEPIPLMLERVKGWLAEGRKVQIVTARVSASASPDERQQQAIQIGLWCKMHLGCIVPVRASKDFSMYELWDDRAVQVEKNTGVALVERLEQDRKDLLGMLRDVVAEVSGADGDTLRMARALLKRFDG